MMTNASSWVDDAITHLKRLEKVAGEIKIQAPTNAGPIVPQASTTADPHAVAAALAEFMKSDNATSQAISVRVYNLATKYSQKAF